MKIILAVILITSCLFGCVSNHVPNTDSNKLDNIHTDCDPSIRNTFHFDK